MSEEPTDRYARLREERPELFRNEPGGIEILTDPAAVEAAGGVVYEDPYVLLVRDAVRFPNGYTGAYIRAVSATAEPGCVVLPLLGDRVVLIEHYRHATRSWQWEVPRGFGTAGLTGEANAAKELVEEIGAKVRELVPLGSVHPDSGITGDRVLLFAARIDAVGRLETGEAIRRSLTVSSAEAEAMIADGRITDGFTIAVMTRARLAGLTA
ncbi:NUDIX hydrolase [Streptomyces sp. NRRL B-24572]|uniref:NUDIX hydrolase n=1 Tax=Streptomyces sp. NRRL B-24572 TaxID=1962156 RepID=UPI000A3B5C26|nr:NUDIX hydrolase [Streptomyces sp. NRRL B-24572]